jgi:hypothetical protein
VRWKPATANSRYRGCQAFFRWCLEEEIIDRPARERRLGDHVGQPAPDGPAGE